ncbi:hypothetical protein GBA52_001786 [Prunus armeniaca]|nr:hypothetical protein GBA52_001786 [Prunus armeniaca]
MANPQQISLRPWILEAVPFIVVLLIVAHVLALEIQARGTNILFDFCVISHLYLSYAFDSVAE